MVLLTRENCAVWFRFCAIGLLSARICMAEERHQWGYAVWFQFCAIGLLSARICMAEERHQWGYAV
eukprot:c7907_g1_i1 orf=309-506(+)